MKRTGITKIKNDKPKISKFVQALFDFSSVG